ncbi:MAG: XdhC family protein [Acidobacteria bacterium]|nr:XdhC family protein [Acidobacteriota bacterium]
MNKEFEFWQFIASHLKDGERVMLLVVATSSGSSPGRSGYKMAVSADGELCGSIGGGVMEVNLVEQSRGLLSDPGGTANGFPAATLVEQVHQKNSTDPSGMICSGKQTVILKRLTSDDAATIDSIAANLLQRNTAAFEISNVKFQIVENETDRSRRRFSRTSESEFVYTETLGTENRLFIIGGGHCALALSELMSKLDFRISIFDDRPDLNTIEKNEFADEITIVDGYENIGNHIPGGDNVYVVVMTLGYRYDEIVIRSLFSHNFKYFGVLGSRAKMNALMTGLEKEGFDTEKLAQIHTPIGLPINSRTPEEIAVSIAAELIKIKNQ